MPYYGRIFSDHAGDRVGKAEEVATNSARYFAQLATVDRAGSSTRVSFAVEGQSDASTHQTCRPDRGCTDVTVRSTPEGLLYLHAARNGAGDAGYFTHHGGWTSRGVELSASDAGSALKVYREVEVDPPEAAAEAGCEDYGDDTPEAYTCLFLRELLPAGQAAAADEAALRARLPKLVKDRADYSLVFAEEFNGVPAAADADGCRDGLSTLDPGVWNYYNACDDVDSRGEPCGNVGGGGFTMGMAGACGLGGGNGFLLGTQGLLHMKYGYLEARYTFNTDQWPEVYNNYNMILHAGGLHLRELRDPYGVEIETWEDWLKHTPVEIDIFEHDNLVEGSGQYANWGLYDRNLASATSRKLVGYCRNVTDYLSWVVTRPAGRAGDCRTNHTFDVTRGIEWTPSGYRYFIKVAGRHSEFSVAPADKIYVSRRFDNANYQFEGGERDRFFEHLVAGDESSVLERVAVGHVPLPFNLNIWGFMSEADHPYIRRRMTFDYVRIWQPDNHYADMEPVYQ